MRDVVYAHSLPGKDEELWEELPEHLTNVADMAGKLATTFGGQELARAMGALHDIGKAQNAFQSYIRGQGASVDHSTAGAVIAERNYPAPFGRMMAYGIAGHHAGLANGGMAGGGLSSLKDRLAGAAATSLPASLLTSGLDIGPAAVTLAAPVLSDGFTHEFSAAFLMAQLALVVDAPRPAHI